MITYTALEADSPSLVMIRAIGNTKDKGLPKELFNKMLSDDVLIKPRIEDLLLDKMAYLDGDKYYLSKKGILMARIFVFYRGLMNVSKGG